MVVSVVFCCCWVSWLRCSVVAFALSWLPWWVFGRLSQHTHSKAKPSRRPALPAILRTACLLVVLASGGMFVFAYYRTYELSKYTRNRLATRPVGFACVRYPIARARGLVSRAGRRVRACARVGGPKSTTPRLVGSHPHPLFGEINIRPKQPFPDKPQRRLCPHSLDMVQQHSNGTIISTTGPYAQNHTQNQGWTPASSTRPGVH